MGIHLAAALGIIAGVSELKLQVLQDIKELVRAERVKVFPLADREGLYIKVECCHIRQGWNHLPGEICVKGMWLADQTILDIMMRKDYRLN